MLNESETLGILIALAQESRLRILRLLLRELPAGLPAGRIAEALGCTPSTLSFHLGHLERVGLVHSRRQAQSIIYAANPETLSGLIGFLSQDCCGGVPESCLPVVPAPAACGPPQELLEG